MNTSSLLADPFTETPQKRGMSEAKAVDTTEKSSESTAIKPSSGSFAARAKALTGRWFYSGSAPPRNNCQLTNPGKPYSRAGQQVVVTGSQTCQQAPCQMTVNRQVSYSFTAISENSNTITDTFGTEGKVEAGEDIGGFKTDVSASMKQEFSLVLQHTAGQNIMNGNLTQVSQTVSTELGVVTMVTFTPQFLCYTSPYDYETTRLRFGIIVFPR
jgi:hypothetical protein